MSYDPDDDVDLTDEQEKQVVLGWLDGVIENACDFIADDGAINVPGHVNDLASATHLRQMLLQE